MTTPYVGTPSSDHTLQRAFRATVSPCRSYDHTPDYMMTTGGRGHQKPLISADLYPLYTVTTPYLVKKGKSGKNGGWGNTAKRLCPPVWSGVDTRPAPLPQSANSEGVR